jgi:hypothetical protein
MESLGKPLTTTASRLAATRAVPRRTGSRGSSDTQKAGGRAPHQAAHCDQHGLAEDSVLYRLNAGEHATLLLRNSSEG